MLKVKFNSMNQPLNWSGVSLILLVIASFMGCSSLVPGIKGSGIQQTEVREVEAFTKIEFSGAFQVEVISDQQPSLSVTADDNLLEFIITEVKDGTLKVTFSQSLSPTISPKFQIKMPVLEKVTAAGAGSFSLKDLESQILELQLSGATSVVGSGIAEKLVIDISGAGSVKLTELVAQSATVKVSGSGAADLQVIDQLQVKISGAGAVRYRGEPTIEQTISGIGSVKPME